MKFVFCFFTVLHGLIDIRLNVWKHVNIRFSCFFFFFGPSFLDFQNIIIIVLFQQGSLISGPFLDLLSQRALHSL